MAIQQVGGQGVYVITGSGRDPRKTSNGQSWADLVTKQKYMLYKSAYDQAMREYEAGSITDKERQKRIDQLRKDIRQERTEIARLERGELTENQLRERQRQRQEAQLGTQRITTRDGSGRAERTDSGIPTIADYQDDLVKKESKARADKVKASGEVAKLEKDPNFARALRDKGQGKVLIGRNKAAYDAKINQYNKAKKDEERAQSNLEAVQEEQDDVDLFPSQQDFEEYYRTQVLRGADPSTTTGGGGGGRGQTITQQVRKGEVPLSDVDYSELIKERQGRIGDIEQQILELEMEPQEERINVLDRAEEISRERYGLGQPRRRLFGRRAEMEALGMEPEEEPQVEEVEPDPVSEMMAEGQAVARPITAPTAQRYTVQEGDTLGSVAQQYYGDPKRFTDIAQASGIQDPNRIEVGQELIIPQDQPQMPSAPAEEPMMEEVVEEQAIAPIQPKPAPTEIGNALRQVEIDRQAQEEMRANQQLPAETPPSLAPAPTPTGMPSIRKLGPIKSYREAMGDKQLQRRRPLPPLQQIRAAFDPVRNLDRRDKQQVGMRLLEQAKQAYGVSSPEYQKAKAQVLSELGKALDPKKAKQMKVVKNLQDNAPSQYSRLGDDIRGLSEDSKRIVVQLFPVSDDTKLDEIERLYKNAQQQLRLSISDKSQKKKALDMLDLMYMAVVSDKR